MIQHFVFTTEEELIEGMRQLQIKFPGLGMAACKKELLLICEIDTDEHTFLISRLLSTLGGKLVQ